MFFFCQSVRYNFLRDIWDNSKMRGFGLLVCLRWITETSERQPSHVALIFLASIVSFFFFFLFSLLEIFCESYTLSHCTGNHILTLSNGSFWRGLWKKCRWTSQKKKNSSTCPWQLCVKRLPPAPHIPVDWFQLWSWHLTCLTKHHCCMSLSGWRRPRKTQMNPSSFW